MTIKNQHIFLVFAEVMVLSTWAEIAARAPSGSATQGTTENADSAAAKAAARKKRFEAMKRRMELGEESGESVDDGDAGGAAMKIVALTPTVSTTASNRRTTEALRVEYELESELSEGAIEVVSAGSVTAHYRLPSLKTGRHTMTIPQGISLSNDPYTFTCNLEGSHYSGITLMVDSLWDNRDRDKGGTNFPRGEDESVYDYKPGQPSDDPHDPPPDEAAAFRGEEVAISSFSIPFGRNRMRRSLGKAMELQILGVGFVEGSAVDCSKQLGSQPKIEATTRVHDVRVVSTASHEMNDQMPVLKAGRFNVPGQIAAHGTHLRIVGKVK